MIYSEGSTIEYGGVDNQVDNDLILFRPPIQEIKLRNTNALLSEKDKSNIDLFNNSDENVLLFGRRHPDVVQLQNILKVISTLKNVETIAIEGPPQLQPVINAVLKGDKEQEGFLRKVVTYFATNHMASISSEVPYIFSYLDVAKEIGAKQILLVDTDFSWGTEPGSATSKHHYKLPAQSEHSRQRESKMISLLQNPITQVGLKDLDIKKLFYDGEANNVPEIMVGNNPIDYSRKLATGKTVLLSGSHHTGPLMRHLNGLGVNNASVMLPTNILNNLSSIGPHM